jgi:hypothetical protein
MIDCTPQASTEAFLQCCRMSASADAWTTVEDLRWKKYHARQARARERRQQLKQLGLPEKSRKTAIEEEILRIDFDLYHLYDTHGTDACWSRMDEEGFEAAWAAITLEATRLGKRREALQRLLQPTKTQRS